METRTYDYLNEKRISIEASTGLLNRVQENIEESPIISKSPDGIIRVSEANELSIIVKDKNLPFVSTRENRTLPYMGVDLFRYGTHVRTIWKKSLSEYQVKTYTELDEKAVLRCFKNFYFENSLRDSFLLHAALVNIENRGILITGRCRSGKTTLAQKISLTNGAKVISCGNTLISNKNDFLLGDYIPRPFYIRFSSIANCPQLSTIFDDLSFCNAVQYLDEDALQRIIRSKSFDVDAGLCISRKKYSDLLSIKTMPSARIRSIIFTQYSPSSPKIEKCSVEEAIELLKQRIFPKKTDLFKLEETNQIIPPDNVILKPDWIEEMNLVKFSFAGESSLTKSLLEDIVALNNNVTGCRR